MNAIALDALTRGEHTLKLTPEGLLILEGFYASQKPYDTLELYLIRMIVR